MLNADNPLLHPQREKVGSETKAKYAYQYHWALHRALQEHGKSNEYAVFVELHEDVVLSNSLDAVKAKFEFNQVKTTATKFTKAKLIKLKNGSSPLGKLIQSVNEKPYADKISELNFVAISGFGIALKKPGLSLRKITVTDIDDTDLSHLELAIKNELKTKSLPAHLQFVLPELSDKSFSSEIIAQISTLISSLFPGSHYNPLDIYRVLIDDINRKGEVTYDFAKWNDLLENKALTCTKVTNVINQYTNIKDQAKIEAQFSSIMTELGKNTLQSRSYKKSFDRYQQSRIGTRTLAQLNTSKAIVKQIHAIIKNVNDNMAQLIAEVYESMDEKVKRNFSNEEDAHAAIICEYIMEN
jgi:Cap4 dsDNA endonuclease